MEEAREVPAAGFDPGPRTGAPGVSGLAQGLHVALLTAGRSAMARRFAKGLTLVELVVMVAAVGLLVGLVAPSARVLRGRDAQAVCLSNLKQIAAASAWYASEDPREQLVPIMWMKVREEQALGFGAPWAWRTALPSAFGGRTPVAPFPGIADPEVMMDDWTWGIRRRPLNGYLLRPSSKDFPVFHCPADTGYPALDPEEWGGVAYLDAPPQVAGVPCYDFLGNSYREVHIGMIWIQEGLALARFGSGVSGQAASAIASPPSQTVLYWEPIFNFLSHQLQEHEPLLGWHGQPDADQVAYCDGSARMTDVGELQEFTPEELEEMGVTDDFDYWVFLRRGPTWQIDCYPTPGALVGVYDASGQPEFDGVTWYLEHYYSGWPFEGYTYNPPP
jgi:hypothetical protein